MNGGWSGASAGSAALGAGIGTGTGAGSGTGERQDFPQDLSEARLPVAHVSVQSVHPGSSGVTILHIQDAHSNLSGQKSLAAALDELMARYPIDLVLVEGGTGDVSLAPLKTIGTRDQWKRAADRLLYEGLIAGEEYLNLTSDHRMRLEGVEERALYRQSVKVYDTVVRHRKETLPYLRRIALAMERVKAKSYTPELLDYEKAVRPAGASTSVQVQVDDEADFGVRTDRLLELAAAARADLASFVSVTELTRLKIAEKRIDFARAQAEEELLISAAYPDRGTEDFKRYLEARKKSRKSPAAQLALLKDLVSRSGRSRESLFMLGAYLKYLEDFSALDMNALLNEMERLEDETYRLLLKDDEDARMLRACDRFVGLLQKAYRIRMSSDEFRMLRVNEADFPTQLVLGFLNRRLLELGYTEDLTAYRPALEDARYAIELFYRLVDKRDRAFVANAKKNMAETGAQTAVLITGGYHTAHLEKLMRAEDWSYAVLTPMVEFETDQAKYEELLLAPLKAVRRKLASAHGSSATRTERDPAPEQGPDKVRDGLRAAAARMSTSRMEAVLTNVFGPQQSSRMTGLIGPARMADPGAITTRLDPPVAEPRSEILPEEPLKRIGQGWFADGFAFWIGLAKKRNGIREDSVPIDSNMVRVGEDTKFYRRLSNGVEIAGLADGMGNEYRPALASQTVCRAYGAEMERRLRGLPRAPKVAWLERLIWRFWVSRIISRAHDRAFDRAHDALEKVAFDERARVMGTTLSAYARWGRFMTIASLGDSRIGTLHRYTKGKHKGRYGYRQQTVDQLTRENKEEYKELLRRQRARGNQEGTAATDLDQLRSTTRGVSAAYAGFNHLTFHNDALHTRMLEDLIGKIEGLGLVPTYIHRTDATGGDKKPEAYLDELVRSEDFYHGWKKLISSEDKQHIAPYESRALSAMKMAPGDRTPRDLQSIVRLNRLFITLSFSDMHYTSILQKDDDQEWFVDKRQYPVLKTVELRPGDLILLTSDAVPDNGGTKQVIQEAFDDNGSPELAAKEILALVVENGAKPDDTSLLVVDPLVAPRMASPNAARMAVSVSEAVEDPEWVEFTAARGSERQLDLRGELDVWAASVRTRSEEAGSGIDQDDAQMAGNLAAHVSPGYFSERYTFSFVELIAAMVGGQAVPEETGLASAARLIWDLQRHLAGGDGGPGRTDRPEPGAILKLHWDLPVDRVIDPALNDTSFMKNRRRVGRLPSAAHAAGRRSLLDELTDLWSRVRGREDDSEPDDGETPLSADDALDQDMAEHRRTYETHRDDRPFMSPEAFERAWSRVTELSRALKTFAAEPRSSKAVQRMRAALEREIVLALSPGEYAQGAVDPDIHYLQWVDGILTCFDVRLDAVQELQGAEEDQGRDEGPADITGPISALSSLGVPIAAQTLDLEGGVHYQPGAEGMRFRSFTRESEPGVVYQLALDPGMAGMFARNAAAAIERKVQTTGEAAGIDGWPDHLPRPEAAGVDARGRLYVKVRMHSLAGSTPYAARARTLTQVMGDLAASDGPEQRAKALAVFGAVAWRMSFIQEEGFFHGRLDPDQIWVLPQGPDTDRIRGYRVAVGGWDALTTNMGPEEESAGLDHDRLYSRYESEHMRTDEAAFGRILVMLAPELIKEPRWGVRTLIGGLISPIPIYRTRTKFEDVAGMIDRVLRETRRQSSGTGSTPHAGRTVETLPSLTETVKDALISYAIVLTNKAGFAPDQQERIERYLDRTVFRVSLTAPSHFISGDHRGPAQLVLGLGNAVHNGRPIEDERAFADWAGSEQNRDEVRKWIKSSFTPELAHVWFSALDHETGTEPVGWLEGAWRRLRQGLAARFPGIPATTRVSDRSVEEAYEMFVRWTASTEPAEREKLVKEAEEGAKVGAEVMRRSRGWRGMGRSGAAGVALMKWASRGESALEAPPVWNPVYKLLLKWRMDSGSGRLDPKLMNALFDAGYGFHHFVGNHLFFEIAGRYLREYHAALGMEMPDGMITMILSTIGNLSRDAHFVDGLAGYFQTILSGDVSSAEAVLRAVQRTKPQVLLPSTATQRSDRTADVRLAVDKFASTIAASAAEIPLMPQTASSAVSVASPVGRTRVGTLLESLDREWAKRAAGTRPRGASMADRDAPRMAMLPDHIRVHAAILGAFQEGLPPALKTMLSDAGRFDQLVRSAAVGSLTPGRIRGMGLKKTDLSDDEVRHLISALEHARGMASNSRLNRRKFLWIAGGFAAATAVLSRMNRSAAPVGTVHLMYFPHASTLHFSELGFDAFARKMREQGRRYLLISEDFSINDPSPENDLARLLPLYDQLEPDWSYGNDMLRIALHPDNRDSVFDIREEKFLLLPDERARARSIRGFLDAAKLTEISVMRAIGSLNRPGPSAVRLDPALAKADLADRLAGSTVGQWQGTARRDREFAAAIKRVAAEHADLDIVVMRGSSHAQMGILDAELSGAKIGRTVTGFQYDWDRDLYTLELARQGKISELPDEAWQADAWKKVAPGSAISALSTDERLELARRTALGQIYVMFTMDLIQKNDRNRLKLEAEKAFGEALTHLTLDEAFNVIGGVIGSASPSQVGGWPLILQEVRAVAVRSSATALNTALDKVVSALDAAGLSERVPSAARMADIDGEDPDGLPDDLDLGAMFAAAQKPEVDPATLAVVDDIKGIYGSIVMLREGVDAGSVDRAALASVGSVVPITELDKGAESEQGSDKRERFIFREPEGFVDQLEREDWSEKQGTPIRIYLSLRLSNALLLELDKLASGSLRGTYKYLAPRSDGTIDPKRRHPIVFYHLPKPGEDVKKTITSVLAPLARNPEYIRALPADPALGEMLPAGEALEDELGVIPGILIAEDPTTDEADAVKALAEENELPAFQIEAVNEYLGMDPPTTHQLQAAKIFIERAARMTQGQLSRTQQSRIVAEKWIADWERAVERVIQRSGTAGWVAKVAERLPSWAPFRPVDPIDRAVVLAIRELNDLAQSNPGKVLAVRNALLDRTGTDAVLSTTSAMSEFAERLAGELGLQESGLGLSRREFLQKGLGAALWALMKDGGMMSGEVNAGGLHFDMSEGTAQTLYQDMLRGTPGAITGSITAADVRLSWNRSGPEGVIKMVQSRSGGVVAEKVRGLLQGSGHYVEQLAVREAIKGRMGIKGSELLARVPDSTFHDPVGQVALDMAYGSEKLGFKGGLGSEFGLQRLVDAWSEAPTGQILEGLAGMNGFYKPRIAARTLPGWTQSGNDLDAPSGQPTVRRSGEGSVDQAAKDPEGSQLALKSEMDRSDVSSNDSTDPAGLRLQNAREIIRSAALPEEIHVWWMLNRMRDGSMKREEAEPLIRQSLGALGRMVQPLAGARVLEPGAAYPVGVVTPQGTLTVFIMQPRAGGAIQIAREGTFEFPGLLAGTSLADASTGSIIPVSAPVRQISSETLFRRAAVMVLNLVRRKAALNEKLNSVRVIFTPNMTGGQSALDRVAASINGAIGDDLMSAMIFPASRAPELKTDGLADRTVLVAEADDITQTDVTGMGTFAVRLDGGVVNAGLIMTLSFLMQNTDFSSDRETLQFIENANILLRTAFGDNIPKIKNMRAIQNVDDPSQVQWAIEFEVPARMPMVEFERSVMALQAVLTAA